ncbi:MAG: hypothetical protein JW786_00010 [Desulfobacterales bacterium]|nr:hypothetical protein [Desulfobacterales bacterium]
MKEKKFWFAILMLVVFTLACSIGSPSMKSPSSESRDAIPLYSNLKEIKLDEEDKRSFVTDSLGYEYLLSASTTDISWSEDTGSDVREQLDTKLSDEKWRLKNDWMGSDQFLISEWRKGNLELLVVVLDNLTSEDISTLNKKYGISNPTPGSTLILSHAIDISQPLPNTTATAQVESQSATATAEFANFSASATAQVESQSATATAEFANFSASATSEIIENSIQATQSAKATHEASITLQAQFEVLSEDFNSGQLSDKWIIYRSDPTRWDLSSTPGFLHIVGSPEREAGILNIFGTRVTYSDVEAITHIESRNMLDHGQSAWVAFTPDDYSNVNYTVELGVSFDDRDGYQIYMWECDNCYSTKSLGKENITYEGSIYLKLARVGKNYIGYYSYDGLSWIFVGERKDFSVHTDQITIGAGTGKNYGEEFDAYFDYLHFGAP